jgi:hypothetical protein
MEKHRTTLEKPQKTIDKLIENHRKILEKTWINPKEPQRNTEEKPYESVYREVPVGRSAGAAGIIGKYPIIPIGIFLFHGDKNGNTMGI